MTKTDAARRLGVAEHDIRDLADHPAGALATLKSGRVMLVADTVCRVYVPEVDDPAREYLGEVDVTEHVAEKPVKLPAETTVKPVKAAAKRKGNSGAAG